MTLVIYVLSVALVLTGGVLIAVGAPIVYLEQGWTEVICGSLAASAGLVIFVLGVFLSRVDAMRLSLETLAATGLSPRQAAAVDSTRSVTPPSSSIENPIAKESLDEFGTSQAPQPAPAAEPAAAGSTPVAEPTPVPPEPTFPTRELAPASGNLGDITVEWAEDEIEGFAPSADTSLAARPIEPPVRPATRPSKQRALPNFLASVLAKMPEWKVPRPAMRRAEPTTATGSEQNPFEEAFAPASPVPPPIDLSFDWATFRAEHNSEAQEPPAALQTEAAFEDGQAEEPDASPGDHRPDEAPLEDQDNAWTVAAPSEVREESPEPELAQQAASAPDEKAPHPLAPTVVGRYNAGSASYVMYSNGMIEVETETGVHLFGSMQELKAFIEQRDAARV